MELPLKKQTLNQKKSNPIISFFKGEGVVVFTLCIGIIFLFTNYQSIIYSTNPHNSGENEKFVYWLWLRIVISHIDAFFFALTTSIIIFQIKNMNVKMLFCGFEGAFIALSLIRDKLQKLISVSEDAIIVFLILFIAIYSAFAFFYLGMLANIHHETLQTLLPSPIADQSYKTIPTQKLKKSAIPKFAIPTQKIEKFAKATRYKLTKDTPPKENKEDKTIEEIMKNIPELQKLNQKTQPLFSFSTKSPYSGKANEEVKKEIFRLKAENPDIKDAKIAKMVNKSKSLVSKVLNGKI